MNTRVEYCESSPLLEPVRNTVANVIERYYKQYQKGGASKGYSVPPHTIDKPTACFTKDYIYFNFETLTGHVTRDEVTYRFIIQLD